MDNVTEITTETIRYDIDAECPLCGRERVFRETDKGTVCGTGRDCGKRMDTSDDCWSCRAEMDTDW